MPLSAAKREGDRHGMLTAVRAAPRSVEYHGRQEERMRDRIVNILLMIALSLTALPGLAEEPKKEPEPLAIKAGDTAPDFTLLAYDGQGVKPVSLRDFRGKKNVVLAFFVFAFTGG
jgi:hypothetical protein